MAVFVSYSSHDGDVVRTLASDLRRAGHEIWLDQDLTGGEAWWLSILGRIRECSVFVVALSDNALSSKPCRAEIEYARALGVPVLPVQIGHVSSLRTVPISQIQVVDYRERTATHGIALITALAQSAAQRAVLPSPLPMPPPIPYAYLPRLGAAIARPHLSPADQSAAIVELRQALSHEDDSGVRRDITALLVELRRHPDVTYRNVGEIDAVLAEAGSTAAGPPDGPVDTPTAPRRAKRASRAAAAPSVPVGSEQAELTGPEPTAPGKRTGSPFSVAAMVLGVLSVIPSPTLIAFGPLGIFCVIVAAARSEPHRFPGLLVVLGGILLGIVQQLSP